MSRLKANPSAGEFKRELEDARAASDALFEIVHERALYERPIDERHRIIFYLGHLEVFDWNLIGRTTFDMKPMHPEFEHLFAFGIDPVDGKLPQDKPADWPSVETIRQYNAKVRAALDDCVDRYDGDGTILAVAIEHRLMHIETLTYMLHWLPFDMKKRAALVPRDALQPRPEQRQVRVPAGRAVLGLNRTSGVFGWDNEFESMTVDVPEFEIDAFKVSNGDYLEFVEAGGYDDRALWSEEAFEWLRANDIRHPKFWSRSDDEWHEWRYRSMFAELPLPLSWPVYVSHAEASAFAKWKGKSLPTEAEFHRALSGPQPRGNYGLQRWDPWPVNALDDGGDVAIELIGNGWEWTSTPFAPFPGFERFPFYPGYSADFFDNKHFVLKGASPRTPSRLTRPTFRNWFQAFYPHIYSGFRCVSR